MCGVELTLQGTLHPATVESPTAQGLGPTPGSLSSSASPSQEGPQGDCWGTAEPRRAEVREQGCPRAVRAAVGFRLPCALGDR